YMSIFGKLAFWKKEDEFSDFDLGKEPGMGLDSDPMGSSNNFGMPHDQGMSPRQNSSWSAQPSMDSGFSPQGPPSSPQHGFGAGPQSSGPDYIVSKEIELISSKLDGLRASLESVNARLSNLERMFENDMKRRW
ncbi:MAG: hypothetical protein ABIH34_07695, partial [Nanoarchaeota archaeon]